MKSAFLYVCIGALFFLWVTEKCAPDPEPSIPVAVADSLRILREASAQRDTAIAGRDSIITGLQAVAENAVERARRTERANVATLRNADSLRRELQNAATAADSVPVLVKAVANRDTTIARQDTVIQVQRVVIAAQDSALTLRTMTIMELAADRDDWKGAHDRMERVAEDLGARLRRTQRFPNERDWFVAGVLAGAGIIVGVAKVSGG